MSNEAHTFSASDTGVVSSYTGGGTTISLYDGTTPVVYDGTGTAVNTWKVVATFSAGTITVGELTDSGTFVTADPPSDMTSDSASILYTITGKRADGSAINLTKTQSFSKSKAGANSTVPGPPSTVPGPNGLRTAHGYLYYVKTTAGAPSAPTGYTYTWSTGVMSGTEIGTTVDTWNNFISTQEATSSNKHYAVSYTVLETTASSTSTTGSAAMYGTVKLNTSFAGIVTFSGSDLVAGETTYNPITIINGETTTNFTTIEGAKIASGTINAEQLTISANTKDEASSMFFDGANKRIEIRDAAGALRVRLGNLVVT